MILTTLADEARKYEQADRITRYPHHTFIRLILNESGDSCSGVILRDEYTGCIIPLYGQVILALGGLNGMFPDMTTGTKANSAQAAATLFSQGVLFGNLEMIQYHPTTVTISGKRMLISETARGEGGRLYVERDHQPWYFMEEKYPERGNLMPRDVVSRESWFALSDPDLGDQIYLDMRGGPEDSWKNNLSELRDEILHYKNLDPVAEPIPVTPGIHYFMSGIDVDVRHRTNIKNLYAAGERCDQYHGANRLGGNSTLGALYGGGIAADQAASEQPDIHGLSDTDIPDLNIGESSGTLILKIRDILLMSMGIVRNEEKFQQGLAQLENLEGQNTLNGAEKERINLAKAKILSAELRRESRGAHYREDYPEPDSKQRRKTLAYCRHTDIANRLGFSKPSVSAAVNNLRKEGFLKVDKDRMIILTEEGQARAQMVYDKFCFGEKAFEMFGLDPKTAEDEACRVEHALSDEAFLQIKHAVHFEEK